MILIVFPLRIENPFPKKIVTGKLTELEPGVFLTLAGTGSFGAVNLDSILKNHVEIESVIEFGGAALVDRGEIGKLYECTRFYSSEGELIHTAPHITSCPESALSSGDEVYTGGKLAFSAKETLPSLYSMETLGFLKASESNDCSFHSLRLATDVGEGDLMDSFRSQIQKGRKVVKDTIFELIKNLKN